MQRSPLPIAIVSLESYAPMKLLKQKKSDSSLPVDLTFRTDLLYSPIHPQRIHIHGFLLLLPKEIFELKRENVYCINLTHLSFQGQQSNFSWCLLYRWTSISISNLILRLRYENTVMHLVRAFTLRRAGGTVAMMPNGFLDLMHCRQITKSPWSRQTISTIMFPKEGSCRMR